MVTFKLINGSQFYYAGDDGNIYSNFGSGFKKLHASTQSTGKYYCLSIIQNGVRKTHRVHRLICLTYHGIPEKGMTCSHIDGDWKNNKPDNLMWEQHKVNLARKKEHGTDDTGHKNTRALITKEQLLTIRELLSAGQTHSSIAKLFNVNRVFITKIKNGHRYKDQ